MGLLESNIWKSVLEGLIEKYVLIFTWGLDIFFNSHYHVMAVIFAVPTLKKAWECIPKSVSLKYKTAVWSFFVDISPGKGSEEKKSAD